MNHIKKIFSDITLMLSSGGYHSYYRIGPPFALNKVREIYEKSKCDFVIHRDVFVKDLTLERFNNRIILKLCMFIYEYLRHVYIVIKRVNWLYEVSFHDVSQKHEVFFADIKRPDLKSDKYNLMSVYEVQGNDMLNSFVAVLPCFSFKKLFKKRLMWHSKKFRYSELPKHIIIKECDSLESRALYEYADRKNITISISWPLAGRYLYTKEQLINDQNLDRPVELIRPKYVENVFENIDKPIIIDDDILLVVPADYGVDRIIQWIINCKSAINAKRYFFSIHPSSQYLIQHIDKLDFGKIDYDKDNYFKKYEYFAGMYSNLLKDASDNKKNVITIAFNELDIEYCDVMNSNTTIYNASHYENMK